MKKLCLIMLAVMTVTSAFAQNIEQVYTRDGNIYYGYISRQPTSGTHFQFVAERQLVVIPATEDVRILVEKKDYSRLPKEEQEWLAEERGIFSGDVQVAKIMAKDITYYDTILIGEGGVYSFMTFGKCMVNIAYDDFQKMARTGSAEGATDGIKTVIEMTDGMVYSGDILEQFPGASVTFLSDDKVKRSIAFKDIAVLRYEPINPAKSIFDQTPLLDCITVKNGSPYIGVITTRNFKQGQVTIQDKNGHFAIVSVTDIVAYEKRPVEVKVEEKVEKPAEELPPVLVDTCRCEFNVLTQVEETKTDKFKLKKVTVNRTVVTTPCADLVTVDAVDGEVRINFQTIVRSSGIRIYAAEEFDAEETKWNQTTHVLYPSYTDGASPLKLEYDITKDGDRTIMDIVFTEDGTYIICFEGKDECIAFNVKISKSKRSR